MAKYKVGDWVRVKTANEIALTLDDNAKTNGNNFSAKMLKYCGVMGCITKVDRDGDFLLSTGGPWWWSPEWLKPAFRVGDRVRVKSLREIEATLTADNCHPATRVRFAKGPTMCGAKGMEVCVGTTFTVESVMPFGNVVARENTWTWSPDWLEPIEAAPEATETAETADTTAAEVPCPADDSYPVPTCGWDAFVTAHPAAVAFLKAISFDGDGFKIDADVTAKSLGVTSTKAERWKPKRSERYWCVGANVMPIRDTWLDSAADERRWEIFNCFATEEEAAKAAEVIREALATFHAKAGN